MIPVQLSIVNHRRFGLKRKFFHLGAVSTTVSINLREQNIAVHTWTGVDGISNTSLLTTKEGLKGKALQNNLEQLWAYSVL